MSIARRSRKVLQKIVFGDTFLPQEFFIGFPEPQTEITVWLHGLGPRRPIDVTCRHLMACAAPLTVCIAFDEREELSEKDIKCSTLKFCERNGKKRVLGEIGLKPTTSIAADGLNLILFEPRSSVNYCLPKTQLWAHYLFHAYSQWRAVDTADMKMSFLERRAAMVMFIRPHPVSLVSLDDETGGNIFPMNLMGDLGNAYFAFALKDSRRAAHLVERTRRIALSNVPLSQAPLAYQLAINHTKERIEWDRLPFATKVSTTFNIPIPVFAQRVREMEVTKIHNIGSHVLFLARIVHDETFSKSLGLSVIHGFYQAWRLNGHSVELQASRAEDSIYKRGSKVESR
jgi:flavin reductase (DIM6/NTAB) family NADH-FMN oxidoreductase RutF